MGVIEIDPVQLLEDGLRVGIARRISAALATHLQFPQHHRPPLAVGGEKQESASPSLLSVFSGGGSGAEELPGRCRCQPHCLSMRCFRTGDAKVYISIPCPERAGRVLLCHAAGPRQGLRRMSAARRASCESDGQREISLVQG